jgi:hypothetical protein
MIKRESTGTGKLDRRSNLTMAEGKLYDEPGPEVRQHIESFIKTYDLPVDELLVTDLDEYPVRLSP